MDKTAIKNFAIEARKVLMNSAIKQAGFYGVTKDGCSNPIHKGSDFESYKTVAGTENRIFGEDIVKRANLVKEIKAKGFDQVIEETAYTWFNRIIAIRFMEVNNYLPTKVRVLSSETGSNTPDIITQSDTVELNLSSLEMEKIRTAKNENKYDDAFRILFVKQCNELNEILPVLFEKTNDYMELLLDISYIGDGVVRMLIDSVAESNFDVEKEGQIEIIGWMYQYYNTELKDDTFAKLKKNVKITKERIPAATQLFTPDWIVRYMVENSLGRLWYEGHKDDLLKSNWKYYLDEAEQEPEVEEELVKIREEHSKINPEDIKVIDPCMGSGHILVYAFEVLMQIYVSCGYTERDAAESILKNNLYGLDIDNRAGQLSYFAVMMMARKYNRRVLTKGIVPKVIAIQDSSNVSNSTLKFIAKDDEKMLEELTSIKDVLADAKEYGSILNVPMIDFEAVYARIEEIEGKDYDIIGQIERKNIEESVVPMLNQAKIMAQKYDICVTNPPYMGASGMGVKLSDFVKKNYPNTKSDLSTCFMEKCSKSVKKDGYYSMINIPVWMFLTSYDKLREEISKKFTYSSLLHFGRGVFGSDFGSVGFVIKIGKTKEYTGNYRKLFLKQGSVDSVEQKEKWFFEKKGIYQVKQEKFSRIPGKPVAYWVSDTFIDTFNNKKIGELAKPRQGLATGCNDIFVRFWYEVLIDKVKFDCTSIEQAIESKRKWFPYNKGGDFRKWYGNNDFIVNWENDGLMIKNFKDDKGKLRSRPQNTQFYFKEADSWSLISSGIAAFRYKPYGHIFDVAGMSCFSEDKLFYILGFLNSNIVMKMLGVLAPTINFQAGDIANIPLIFISEKVEYVESFVHKNIKLSKKDWDSFETSWDYKENPLAYYAKGLWDVTATDAFLHKLYGNVEYNSYIEKAFLLWQGECDERFNQLKANEEELNRIFIDIYGLQDELSPEVEDKDVTVRKADLTRDIKNFISYAVGCMFGRYSIDYEGLAFAGGDWDASRYSRFIPDTDNIIPICDEDYFEDDITTRFIEFVRVVFGENTFEQNLQFIADALGGKGNPKDVIRNYFQNDFYKDHVKKYQKRPIYWLFDSGKSDGFKCLVYLHRYNKDTLGLIRSDYLTKAQSAIENSLKNAEYTINNSGSAVDRAQATKKRDTFIKQLAEIKTYFQALSHMALQKIELDLDDGVKVNYEKFQGVEVANEGEKKQVIDLLAKI